MSTDAVLIKAWALSQQRGHVRWFEDLDALLACFGGHGCLNPETARPILREFAVDPVEYFGGLTTATSDLEPGWHVGSGHTSDGERMLGVLVVADPDHPIWREFRG